MAKKKGIGRLVYLDLFKTMLVWGMVLAYGLVWLARGLPAWSEHIVTYLRLVSFSGLMLAFGIGLGLQSKDGRGGHLGARLVAVVLMLAATYAYSLAYAYFTGDRPIGVALGVDALALRYLPMDGPYLASFAVLYGIVALARPLLLVIGRNLPAVALLSAACLGSTFLADRLPVLGFPLIAHAHFLWMGLYLGQAGKVANIDLVMAGAISSGLFAGFVYFTGTMPGQLPPHALWVLGAGLPLTAYLFAAQFVAGRVGVPGVVTLPGKYVPVYFLAAAIAAFAGRAELGRFLDDWAMVAAATIGTVAAVTLALLVFERLGNR